MITVTGDSIEAIVKQLGVVTGGSPVTTVLAELASGKCPRGKMQAIKRYLELSGSTLIEARDAIEASVASFVWEA